MRMFDIQGIEIAAPRRKVFEFLRDPGNLPRWAQAFASVGNGRARLETSTGAVDVGLGVTADADTGVVDWRLTFPDGSVGIAQSRVSRTRYLRSEVLQVCVNMGFPISNSRRSCQFFAGGQPLGGHLLPAVVWDLR